MPPVPPAVAFEPAFVIENADGGCPVLLNVDHATHHLPADYAGLGLDDAARMSHIGWDPGAIEVARGIAARLDAPLIATTASRLVVDVNRPETSATLIPTISETTIVPGNLDLPDAARQARIDRHHAPYHAALRDLVADRAARTSGRPFAVVAIHTFTPVFKGVARLLHAGVLFGADDRLGRAVLARLATEPGLTVRANEPYSPADEVYTTLDRHAVADGHLNVMIEIRNDLVATAEGQARWSDRLADAIGTALAEASP